MKLANHDRLHHSFEIAFVIQKLGVLQHVFVGLRLDACERFKQAALCLCDVAALVQALVDARVFGIALVFGAQLIVLAVSFLSSHNASRNISLAMN